MLADWVVPAECRLGLTTVPRQGIAYSKRFSCQLQLGKRKTTAHYQGSAFPLAAFR